MRKGHLSVAGASILFALGLAAWEMYFFWYADSLPGIGGFGLFTSERLGFNMAWLAALYLTYQLISIPFSLPVAGNRFTRVLECNGLALFHVLPPSSGEGQREDPASPFRFLDFPLGREAVPGTTESGFYPQEHHQGAPYRWTNGAAKLTVPVSPTNPPKTLSVSLGFTRPSGTRVLASARVGPRRRRALSHDRSVPRSRGRRASSLPA